MFFKEIFVAKNVWQLKIKLPKDFIFVLEIVFVAKKVAIGSKRDTDFKVS